MEPLTTSVMISGIVTYLGKQLAENKTLKKIVSGCTDATTNWILKLFGKGENQISEDLQKLKENPDSDARKSLIEAKIKTELEDDPTIKKYIEDIFKQMSNTEEGGKIVARIANSKNVNVGNVKINGGNFQIGDNNT